MQSWRARGEQTGQPAPPRRGRRGRSAPRRGDAQANGGRQAVNSQVNRLAVVAVALLVVLIVATTYWQTWAVAGLQDRQDNAIQQVEQFTVARGRISADGRTSAANRKVKRQGKTFYFRKYPSSGLAAQTVGYSTQARSQAGLERSM